MLRFEKTDDFNPKIENCFEPNAFSLYKAYSSPKKIGNIF